MTKVAAFGAFVDIGVHQDGLVHISAMSKTFVKDPSAGANWEIAVDGMPRSYRVDRQIAIELDAIPAQCRADWRVHTARQVRAQHYQCKRMTTKSDIASAAATRKKIGATHMT